MIRGIPQAAFARFQELEREEQNVRQSIGDQRGTEIPSLYGFNSTFLVNPSNIGTGILARMIELDDTIASAHMFSNLMVLAKIGEYHHEKRQDIADFVNESLNNLIRPTWQEAKESMLSARGFGFSVTEKVYGLNNLYQKVPVRLPTYHPSTIAFEVDQTGQITDDGVLQFVLQYNQMSNPNNIWAKINYGWKVKNPFETPSDRLHPTRIPFLYQYGLTRIPRDKVIHHVGNAGMSFGNPYGKTPVRTAHLLWQLKVFFLKQMGIAGKRNATSKLWATAPKGEANVKVRRADGTDDLVSPREAVRKMLAEAEMDDGIVTGTENEGYKIEVLQSLANLGDFVAVINAIDVWMFRCWLLPSLVMTDGSAGSRSLGDKHFEIVDHVAGSDAEKFTKTLMVDLIQPMIIDNFGTQKDYGGFTNRPQSTQEREILSNIYNTLTTSGWMKPHVKEDMDFVRKSLSLPKDMDRGFDIDVPGGVDDGTGKGKPAGQSRSRATEGDKESTGTKRQPGRGDEPSGGGGGSKQDDSDDDTTGSSDKKKRDPDGKFD